MGRYGWQSILVVGGIVPILFAAAFVFVLPESIRFLTLRQDRRDALAKVVNAIAPGTADARTEFIIPEPAHPGRNSVGLVLSRRYRVPTVMLWIGLFMNLLTVYLLNSWLPIMVRDAGFSLTDAALVGAMMQVGGTLGNISIGWGMDRWGPHVVLVCVLVAAAVFAALIGVEANGVALLMALIFLLGFCTNSSNTGWTALAAQFYPTEIRATGTSVMTGVGRFGAIFGATVGGLLLGQHWSFGQVFTFLTLPIGIAIVAAVVKARSSANAMDGTPFYASARALS